MKYATILILLLTIASCASRAQQVVTGAQRLDVLLPQLGNKRVALMVNYTATLGKTHLVDTLKSLKVDIRKIFAPEHGFRGAAANGETVDNERDKRTGLEIVSLYGKNNKATPEQLADVDVVIFDIQDVGVRFFTYISSLHYLMESCSESGKKLIILDRPNPTTFIDGPILKPEFKSFVGMHPIPIAHGLTVGELARMINGEGWLKGGERCDLEVVGLKNYTHDTPYALPLKPSPNLPNNHAVALYPYTCLFEGTVLSIGRGTQFPFEVTGHPDLVGQPFQFTPVKIPGMSMDPPQEGKLCYGIDMRKDQPVQRISLQYLIRMYNAFPQKDKFFIPYFEKLAGTAALRTQIEKGMTEDDIRATWQAGLEQYRLMRSKYTLYK